tara:strand:+ start:409 stop:1170 length:762 start_codon:yes stop_codon:yes gene_type:complete
MWKINNKKGQIAIFVILALILVTLISLIFVVKKGPDVKIIDEQNPQAFIEGCTREAVEDALNLIMKQGGDIEPRGMIRFDGENITYLCYNENYYSSCTNQRPMLLKHIKNEITEYVRPRVSNCFESLKKELEPRYVVEMDTNWELTTILATQEVKIEINREFKMKRGDEIRNFELFKINIISPVYELAKTAIEITNQESEYCYFNINGFNMNYPKWEVRKEMMDDSKIYKIKERASNQKFNFAIRGCVMPPGF